jgi:hypothetical protein
MTWDLKGVSWLVVGLVSGALLWKVLPSNAAKTKLTWKIGNQSVTLDVAKDLSDPEAMIKTLFATSASRSGILQLLRERGIFAADDIALVDALAGFCPAEVGRETVVQRQHRLNKCFQNKVLQELRQLAKGHQPPFQYVGREVLVGTPPGTSLTRGSANVCSSGEFVGQTLQLGDLEGKRVITVQARGRYPCLDVFGAQAEVQISAADTLALFNRPTDKVEHAIAVVVAGD